MTRVVVVFTAVLLASACRGASHGGGEASAGSPATDSQAVVGVSTAVAALHAFPQIVQAIGTVVARPGRFAELSAPAPTRVAAIYVTPGQLVAEGDSLVAFERAPFDAAARSAAAALDAAEHTHARAVRLVAAGILPQKDADQSAADLAQAEAAAVLARRAQQLATLRAPLAGVVTRMNAVLGASVDANQPLVAVTDPHALDVVFDVAPSEAAGIHVGDSVSVTSREGQGGEPLGRGVLSAVGAIVDSASRAVLVRARLAHPARPLRIGESAFGRIETAVHPHAVTVPVEALVPAGDGYRVFVVDSAGVAHARPVTPGARGEALVEITHGLAAGETVVTTGAYGVDEGVKIVRPSP